MPGEGGQDVTGDRDRFEHMLGAARDAIAFAEGKVREDLDHDALLRRGLVNCVQVIGEAAARTTEAGRRRAPGVPWAKMVGMRHILVHAYFNIDWDTIWGVVREHMPLLVRDLEVALRNWDRPPASS